MKLQLLLIATVVFLLFPATGSAAPAHKPYRLLKVGSRGRAVKDAQWLLGGHKPSVYPFAPYRGRPTGEFGARTARAVLAIKWRLGYPLPAAKRPVFGRDLYLFLTGKKARPLAWLGRAAQRIHHLQPRSPAHAASCDRRVVAVARRELALHVHEVPDGSNDSPRIRLYQAVTGAFRLPWCASFIQYVYRTAGIGTIANASAGVFYIVDWAHARGWLRARPSIGAAVAYLSALGHIGIVERVTSTGFYTIEGNNGNAVREDWHPLGYLRTVFIDPPCIAPAQPALRRGTR